MKPQKLTHYQRQIMEDTGCSSEEAGMVEDVMREDVFHSTLDWQTREQFREGARKAWRLFQANRADYEAFYRGVREAFLAGRTANMG
jgi:hypothetical protein